MRGQDDKLTIQQMPESTGLTVHTLRYYERVGLIQWIERAENSHRRYTEADIGWIHFLMKLRATGMSIQEMQVYAELQRDDILARRVEMLKALRSKLEAHLDELHGHLDLICTKIETYEGIVAQKQQSLNLGTTLERLECRYKFVYFRNRAASGFRAGRSTCTAR